MKLNSLKARWGRLLVGLVFVVVLLWVLDESSAEKRVEEPKSGAMQVSVIDVHPENHRPIIKTTGIARPRWPVEVVAAVSGRVTHIASDLEPGSLVHKDSLLIELESELYQAELKNSQAKVAQAELEVARIRHERTVVNKINQGNQLTEFAKLEPHLKHAQAELNSAKTAVQYAKKQLEETQIASPFDAVVLDKWVVPGQWVSQGDRLFQLAASDVIDIEVELSNDQVTSLPQLANMAFEISTPAGGKFSAKVRYVSPALAEGSRQKVLVLSIDKPFENSATIFAGELVAVTMLGKLHGEVVEAPATVMTPDGDVWSVVDKQLVKEQITIIEQAPDKVWFQYKKEPKHARQLIRFPISSMIPGQPVSIQNVMSAGGTS